MYVEWRWQIIVQILFLETSFRHWVEVDKKGLSRGRWSKLQKLPWMTKEKKKTRNDVIRESHKLLKPMAPH